jgi:hypothetical protein
MKRILLYFVSASLLVTGCKKQLDIKPEGVFTESQTLASPATAEALLADAYYKSFLATMLSAADNGMGHMIGDASTGITIVGIVTLSGYSTLNGTVLKTNTYVANLWNGHYAAINEANVLITGLPGQTWNNSLRDQFIAEAKFVRAYNYFRLLCLFGDGALNGQPDKPGVPLRLINFQGYDASQNIPRSKNSEVYTQILKDLDEAAAVLTNTETVNLKVRSRAQQATCQALASRVALYMGDNDKAIGYSDQVMQVTSKYTLFPGPAQAFPDNGAATSALNLPLTNEWIFCFPLSYNANTQLTHGMYFFKTIGWPNPAFISSYAAADIRKNMFVTGTAPNATNVGRVCPLKFSAGSALYATVAPPVGATPIRAANFTVAMRDNIVVMRFSEMFLNKAEALAKKNGVTQPAVDMLNAVHQRAGLPAYTLANFPTASSLIFAIVRERRWEFAFEAMDRYDQIRIANMTGLPSDLGIQNLNPALANPQKWVLPIPNNDVVLTNGIITQNPGY